LPQAHAGPTPACRPGTLTVTDHPTLQCPPLRNTLPITPIKPQRVAIYDTPGKFVELSVASRTMACMESPLTHDERVTRLERVVFGNIGQHEVEGTVSRLDFTTLESSLRAEMASLRNTLLSEVVKLRASAQVPHYETMRFRFEAEERLSSLERRVWDLTRRVEEDRSEAK
jgi:hypothetical protein